MSKTSETTENTELEVVNISSSDVDIIDNPFIIKLTRSYTFEDETYSTIDLSGLEELRSSDLIKANKILEKKGGGVQLLPEMTLEYSCIIASIATGLPLEFFYGLRPKDAIKLKNRVTNFFFGED